MSVALTKFQKICWHDGNIINFQYIFPVTKKDNPRIIIETEVYIDDQAPQRHKIQSEFPNVQKVIKNINFNELKDNVWAGSINYASQKEIILNKNRFHEYIFTLFGSKIKIVSKKVKIKILT